MFSSGWLSWSRSCRCQVAHSEDSALTGMVELLPLRFAGGDVHEVLRQRIQLVCPQIVLSKSTMKQP